MASLQAMRAMARKFATVQAASHAPRVASTVESSAAAQWLSKLQAQDTNRSFVALTPDLAKSATQCVAETFASQADPFTWLATFCLSDSAHAGASVVMRAGTGSITDDPSHHIPCTWP